MRNISLEQLIEEWKKDSAIDSTEPAREILKIPSLHSKYVDFLTFHSLALKNCSLEYSRMKKIKWEYYTGRLDERDLKRYGWEPFRFLLKTDIQHYIDADEDLQKITAKKAIHENAMNFCSMVIKELSNRTWQLKEYMAFERFIAGQ